MTTRRRYSALATLLLLGVMNAASANGQPTVVASFSILADMAAYLGGEHVQVTSLVGPDSDAHMYQPTPGDARRLGGADLVIMNGMDFEGWMPRLLASAGFTGPVVVASTGVEPMIVRGAEDPHAWQSLTQAKTYVDNIVAALIDLKPAFRDDFLRRQAAFVAELERLEIWARDSLHKVPQQRKVVTSHDAFAYLGRDFAIEFLAPIGASTEDEASAAGVAQLIQQIRQERIRAMFVESISDPRLLQQIARETGVAVGATLYSDALSGPEGPASTYLQMMEHNLSQIINALAAEETGPELSGRTSRPRVTE